jgi:hypothetical protein
LGLVRAWSSEKRSANGREKNWRLVSPFQLGDSNLSCRGSEAYTPQPSFMCSYYEPPWVRNLNCLQQK